MIDLTREGAVFVLRMRAGENRFNPAFVAALNAALDEVEASSGNVALVTTGAEEKFYSNGLDLDWLAAQGAEPARAFIESFFRILGRVLALPLPTVAALNGHTFAGGAFLALTHDFRVMRADRGFFCLPEVDLGMPLSPGMLALIASRMTPPVSRDSILTGARWGGTECVARGVVDEAVRPAEVLPRAIARAAGLAVKDRRAYGRLKRAMYAEAIALLESARMPEGY